MVVLTGEIEYPCTPISRGVNGVNMLNQERITQVYCLLLADNGCQVELEYSAESRKYLVSRMKRDPDMEPTEESQKIPLGLVDSFTEAQEVAWKWIEENDG